MLAQPLEEHRFGRGWQEAASACSSASRDGSTHVEGYVACIASRRRDGSIRFKIPDVVDRVKSGAGERRARG